MIQQLFVVISVLAAAQASSVAHTRVRATAGINLSRDAASFLQQQRKLTQSTSSAGSSDNQTAAVLALAKLQPLIKQLRNSSVYSSPLSTPVYIPSTNGQMTTMYMPILSSLLGSMGDNASAATIRSILTGNSSSSNATASAAPSVKASSGPSDSSPSSQTPTDPTLAYWQTLFNPISPSTSNGSPPSSNSSAAGSKDPSIIDQGANTLPIVSGPISSSSSNAESSTSSPLSSSNSSGESGSSNKALVIALSVGIPCALIVGIISAMLIIRWRSRAAAFKLVADGTNRLSGRRASQAPSTSAAAATGGSRLGTDEEIGGE